MDDKFNFGNHQSPENVKCIPGTRLDKPNVRITTQQDFNTEEEKQLFSDQKEKTLLRNQLELFLDANFDTFKIDACYEAQQSLTNPYLINKLKMSDGHWLQRNATTK